MRRAGADEQVAALAERAAAEIPLDRPYAVVRLLDALHKADADEQHDALASRLLLAGHLDPLAKHGDHAERFRFGREPDGSAAPPWAWQDLD